jgi:hypothetical protein
VSFLARKNWRPADLDPSRTNYQKGGFMTRQIFNIFTAASLLVMLAVAPLFAQSASWMTAQIPFAFVVGNQTLPAGEYTVRPEGHGQSGLLIQNTDGKAAIFALPHAIQSPNVTPHPRLVFHQYGETYFLSELWRPGNNTGQKLNMSPRERELAQGNATLTVQSIVAQQR